MATRTKAQAEKLLQEHLDKDRELRLEAERVAHETAAENQRLALEVGSFDYEAEAPDNFSRARAYCALLEPDDELAVYRRGLQRKEIFVGKIEAQNFDPAVVKEKFGGGEFIFKGYNEKHQIDFRAEISIEGKPKIENEGPVTIDHQTQKPQLDAQQLVAMIQESNRAMFGEIARLLTKPEKSTADVLSEIKTYKELFAPAASPQAVQQPVDQLMSAMKMGADLAAMNGGGGDSNQAWLMKALDMFGKPIMDAIASGQLAPKEPARPALPGTQARIAAPAQQQEDDSMNLMMKGYIGILTKAARQNEDATGYADNILQLIPASELPAFEAMIRADDWQQRMAAYAPSVNDYPGWFSNLRNIVIEFIDADRADVELTDQFAGDSVQTHENDLAHKTKAGDDTGGNA